MYQVYINYSKKHDRYYIGSTEDAEERLEDHNKGKVRSTKGYMPWENLYIEDYKTRQEAYRRERQIKSYKGGEAFKRLVNKNKFKK